MISIWWLVGASAGWMIVSIYLQRVAYRHGIWDGAFNHFLPNVQREMRYYDRHKADAILAAEREELR
jgi:hypothetical protein